MVVGTSRKRRLSRKEQKARKKQAKKAERNAKADENPSVSVVPISSDGRLPSLKELAASYEPTPIPSLEEMNKKHPKSLGKWFPKAIVLKSSVHYTNSDVRKMSKDPQRPSASLLLFYQYVVNPQWPESKRNLLISYLTCIMERRDHHLGGRIRVAREGVNATLSAVDTKDTRGAVALRQFCLDLKNFDQNAFRETDFKFVDHLEADRHFKDLKVLPVQELVFYNFPKAIEGQNDADTSSPEKGGVHLMPRDFHKMLEQDASSTVVVDVRNHYEAALGRFDGQQHTLSEDESKNDKEETGSMKKSAKGAEYIDPKMRKSTDFMHWLEKEETREKLKDKNVMLFCTGGVRCERASAYLRSSFKDNVKGVFQLQGGIERYFKEYPEGGHFRGKNFVFDKREAFGPGNKDGDGGVVDGSPVKKIDGIDTQCCLCETLWDRYVGKKKCATCGVPVLMCDACLSSKELQADKVARCPLCVEENVTVPVQDLEWTNNGLDVVQGKPDKGAEKKVAGSVLKWGGGHATKKKDRKRFSAVPCRFGESCTRTDCFFMHPNKKTTTR